MTRRVAVSGAGGLLGRALTRLLTERGDEVLPLPRGAQVPPGTELVFHLAAQTTVPAAREDPIGTFESNVALAWRTLSGAPRAVFASSDQVYGPRAPAPTREDAPLDPDGPYAASKAAADLLARQLPGVVVARLANLYGPGDAQTSRLVPGTIAAVRAGEAPVIRGDGTAARDMLFVDDAAHALLALADGGTPGEAYNVGTGRATSVREVVDAVLAVAASDLEPHVLGGAPQGEGGRRALDVAKIASVVGWTPATSLAEGLRRTWDAAG